MMMKHNLGELSRELTHLHAMKAVFGICVWEKKKGWEEEEGSVREIPREVSLFFFL